MLSTHFDCVPPFFPSDVRDGCLFGRGSCDAKGILAAQLAAVERMRASGERRVALLFVVGEERGSDGANVANAAAARSSFLINGEPTDSRLAIATRGMLRVQLSAKGRAAHSAVPEHGDSAIDKLVDVLVRLRGMQWPSDPELGNTFYSIGLIEGGIAPNVISPSASAELMFRIVGSADGCSRGRGRSSRTSPSRKSCESRWCAFTRSPESQRRSFRSRPTFPCSIAGARRSCSGRDRFSSRTLSGSTCTSMRSTRRLARTPDSPATVCPLPEAEFCRRADFSGHDRIRWPGCCNSMQGEPGRVLR